jgi:hypothetical protein
MYKKASALSLKGISAIWLMRAKFLVSSCISNQIEASKSRSAEKLLLPFLRRRFFFFFFFFWDGRFGGAGGGCKEECCGYEQNGDDNDACPT